MKIQWPNDRIEDPMAKEERWDKMMWYEREMRKEKKKKNGLSYTYRDSVFDTFGTVKKISTKRF
jgi:hypothetical protein